VPDVEQCIICSSSLPVGRQICRMCKKQAYNREKAKAGWNSVTTAIFITLLCVITTIHLFQIGGLTRGFYAIGGEALVVPVIVLLCFVIKYWNQG